MRLSLFFVTIILSFNFIFAGQTQNGRQYEQINSKWYQIENGINYLVDENIITVKFKSSISYSSKEDINSRQGTTIIRTNILDYSDLQLSSGSDPLTIVQNYLNSGLVDVAEVNTIGEYTGTPDDPRFSDQWHLKDINDHDIDAPEAWDYETGDPNVIISILDSGTDILHEDLEGNIWVNPGEDIDNDGVVWDNDDFNGVDDDGNGKIDDVVGWDFYNDSLNVEGPHYHGTHVAGIAGALTNNNKGVSGVAGGWSTSNKGNAMLICKVGDSSPSGAALNDAILYAAQKGTDIITMSLTVGVSSSINAALQSAYNTYGCFIDCSSGNRNGAVAYPANNEYVFAVGASDQNDQRASFPEYGSNYGSNLDVVAPGVDIWSTRKSNSYGEGGGTSYAAPQIAAIAGLLLSVNSNYSNTDIWEIIASSCEKVGGYSYGTNTSKPYASWNNEMGYGRVNAFQSTLLALAYSNKSTASSATYSNNARHLAKDAGYLHEIFSSGGEIFYRRSNNNGSTWQVTKRLSEGNSSNSKPAITTYYDNSIHIVWQRKVGTNLWDIYYTRSSNYGSSWSSPSTIAQNVQTSSSQNNGPQPVIAECLVQGSWNELMTVYTSSNGIYYTTKTSGSGSWPTPVNISGSYNSYIRFPSLTGKVGYFALVYDTRYYGVYSRTYTGSWTSAVKFSDSAPYYERETCVAQEKQGGDMLATWVARPTYSSPFIVYFRRGYWNNTWSNFKNTFSELNIDYRRPSITYFDADLPNEYAVAIIFHSSDNRILIQKYYDEVYTWSGNQVATNGREANITGYAYDDPKYFWTDQTASPYQVMLSSNFLPKSSTTTEYKNVFARRAVVSNVKDNSAQCLEVSDYLVKTKSGKSYRIAFQSYPDDTVKLDLKIVWNYMDSEPVKLPSDATELVYTKKIYTTLPNDSSGQKFETSFTDASFQLSVVDAKTKSQIAVLDDNAKSAEVHVDISGLAGKEIILYPSLSIAGVNESELNFGLVNIFYQPKEKAETLQKVTITEKIEPLPTTVRLNPNYPNPFNPITHIGYSIPENGAVKLNIYDLQGRLVKTIVNSNQEAGNHVVNWDGTNTSGSSVASGVYIYQLRFKNVLKTRKLLLMR